MVGPRGFEPRTSCVQGSCNKSILLVRLASFCVMGLGLGLIWQYLDPSWIQVFQLQCHVHRAYRLSPLPSPAGQASRKPKHISVLSET